MFTLFYSYDYSKKSKNKRYEKINVVNHNNNYYLLIYFLNHSNKLLGNYN